MLNRRGGWDSQVEAATWESCRADFAFDGAMIELLVTGTGDEEWEAFWMAIRAGPFGLRAFRGRRADPAARVCGVGVFAERQVASVMVSVQSSTVTANCHFFGGDLELDIDSREIVNEAAFESVLAIMRFIATAVRLPVLAIVEGGAPAYAIMRVSPDGRH